MLGRALSSWAGSITWWLCSHIWGDRVWAWLDPMIPDSVRNFTPTLSLLLTYGPPLALFALGFYFYLKKSRVAPPSAEELERRNLVVWQITREYDAARGQSGPALIRTPAPPDYIKRRLKELGENWKYKGGAIKGGSVIGNTQSGPQNNLILRGVEGASLTRNLQYGEKNTINLEGSKGISVEDNVQANPPKKTKESDDGK